MLGEDRLICIRNLARRLDPASRFDSPADELDPAMAGEERFLAYFEAMRDRLARLVAMAEIGGGSVIDAQRLRAMQYAGPGDVELALARMRARDLAEGHDEARVEQAVRTIRSRLLARLSEGPLLLSEMTFAPPGA